MTDKPSAADSEQVEFLRLPGLFRRWEIEQVIEPGSDFHIEEAGTASDGTSLYAVYQRVPIPSSETEQDKRNR